MPSPLDSLRTPELLLDRGRLDRNIRRMNERVKALGVSLRPHLKTAKSRQVARRVFNGGIGPITVSTLREAEYFLEDGFTDLLYAVGMAPGKLGDIAALQAKGAEISVILDHPDMARALVEKSASLESPLAAMIEVDTDGHRAGLAPDDPRLMETAHMIDRAPGLTLKGVLTHAGESYSSTSEDEIRAWAGRERDGAVAAATLLRDAGLPCPTVSVGSTPTATYADHLEGVTELRAGVYMFQDLYQAGLGVCAIDDIAVSVLATVISHRPERGWLIIDAGGLALSKDRSTASQPRDLGFGRVCDLAGRPIADLIVDRADQEHGMVVSPGGHLDVQALPLGSRVRVLPNHSCMTAAAYDAYQVLDDQHEVVTSWGRVNGW